jgi:LEA14-like dessication related protein
MLTIKRSFAALFAILFLSSCATLNPNIDEPVVTVTSFKVLPITGTNLRFQIGLNVSNPNNFDIVVNGLSYNASVEGYDVFSGVTNQVPTLKAYDSDDIVIEAQAGLFNGVRLATDILQKRKTDLNYVLEAKMDVAGILFPIYITKEGLLSLPNINTNL